MSQGQRYNEILCVYLRKKSFLIIVMLTLFASGLSACVRVDQLGKGLFSEILIASVFFVLPFVVSLFIPLSIGTILKSQFAHPRATIYPRFRFNHLLIALFFYVISLLLIFPLLANIFIILEIKISLLQILITLGFSSITIIWLAYIFHDVFWGGLWLASYGYYLLQRFLQKLFTSEEIFMLMGCSFLFLVLALGRRLLTLKEGMWEYSWFNLTERKDWSRYRRWQMPLFWRFKLGKLCTTKERSAVVAKYPQQGSLWQRVRHWHNYLFSPNMRYLWPTVLVLTLAMTSYEKWQGRRISSADDMHPMLILFPMFMSWMQLFSSNIKFENSRFVRDILKPVKRTDFFREVGFATFYCGLVIWTSFFAGFSVLRLILVAPAILQTKAFWLQVVFSLCVQPLVFGLCALAVYLVMKWKSNFMMTLYYIACVYALIFLKDWYQTTAVASWFFLFGGFVVLAGWMTMMTAYHLWYRLEY